MKFHLYYRGSLKANAGADQKMSIRRAFHPQLRTLWNQLPVSSLRDQGALEPCDEKPEESVLSDVGPFTFAPLVTEKYRLVADISVLMLRPQEPGDILDHTGDLDNRVKTLLDALGMPAEQGLPREAKPAADETPFFCLFEDDALAVSVAIRADRLLEAASQSEVVVLIEVTVRPTVGTLGNIALAGT